MFNRLSLATQVSLALSGLSLVIIALTGLFSTLLIKDRLEAHILQDRVNQARHVALPIQTFLADQRQQLLFSVDYQLSPVNQENILRERLREAVERNNMILEIALISPAGEIVASESRSSSQVIADFLPIAPNYTSPLDYAADNTPYIILSQTIHLPNYQGYSIVGRIEMSYLWTVLRQQDLEIGEYIYIVDETGTVIAASQSSTDPKHYFTTPYHQHHGKDLLGATAPIEHTSWLVINELGAKRAFADVREMERYIVLLTLTGALIALASGRFLSKQLIRPFKGLTAYAEHLEAGDYTYQIQEQTPVEVRLLGQTFKRMGDVIAEREIALRATNTILKARSEELAILSRQIIAVEEEERRRISREIHDGFGQTLAALKMTLDVAQNLQDERRKIMLLKDARHIIEQAIDEAHTISQNLRPTVLDDLGLVAALGWYVHQYEQRFGIAVQHDLNPDVQLVLSTEVEITAFRFVQEALNNVQKHAYATEVSIKLRQQVDFLMLAVKDNGAGFDYVSKPLTQDRVHLGLSGMRERLTMIGGELVVHSQIGNGTTLIALLPLKIPEK